MNVYNAGPGLEWVLSMLDDLHAALTRRRIQLDVLVTDDASKDNSWEIIRQFAVGVEAGWLQVAQNPENIGNAQGIMRGYQWALANADEQTFVASCDADGEHNPLDILAWLDRCLLDGNYDGVVGTINYPDHLVSTVDRAGMRMLGELQARAASVEEPFYVHSPGFQIHRARSMVEIASWHLPRYVEFYTTFRDGQFPRWGLNGVILQLLGASGARICSVYLACYGEAPNRTAEKLREQMETGLKHLQVVEEFLALPSNH